MLGGVCHGVVPLSSHQYAVLVHGVHKGVLVMKMP